ncbi:enoyl-CoA hydratase/isomerase family protein [Krasilnikovia sp. MM14-A1259]|uniref:enoyl-CoA hydratase/isomerase family protein n=1 Tax=Krasilnikovia sp. MM14-A1259 TaxID=3373539 RepID=UPI00382B8EAD
MDVTLPHALTSTSLCALAEVIDQAQEPIVIRGDEVTFCLGLSLDEDHAGTADLGSALVDSFVRCVRAIRCGPPAVAFVQGAARGAGVGLAAACDRVLATTTSSFALTELYLGLTPAAIWPLLAERVPEARLRWLALTAECLGAEDAVATGLADAVASAEDLHAALRRLRRTDLGAVRLLKESTAPLLAVAEGAERTRWRLADAEVRNRLARYRSGEPLWR